MKVEPYLFFEGRTEEALAFYKSALGAEVTSIMRFSENPEAEAPPGSEDKILHSSFRIGDTTLMASDGMCKGKAQFEGLSLALQPDSKEEAERLFGVLEDGGEVQMPLGETFFSSAFGMVRDRFGVAWLVVGPGPAK